MDVYTTLETLTTRNTTVHPLCYGMQTYCLYRTVVDVLILLPIILAG